MAITTYTNFYVLINAVDLSDHVSKVVVNDVRAQVDITAMGALFTTLTKGLGDGKISVDFFQDYAAAKVQATLQPLIGSTTPFAVELRPVNAARSATNPAVLMANALLLDYNSVNAKVGDAINFTADFINAGGAGITYPTS